MGFRATRKLYKLIFEHEDLMGLEIIAKGTTLRERKEYLDGRPEPGADGKRLDYDVQYFVDHVVDWNLQDEEGVDLDISSDALQSSFDSPVVVHIVSAWTERMNQSLEVPRDLGKESSGGVPTETTPNTEALLPMEPLL